MSLAFARHKAALDNEHVQHMNFIGIHCSCAAMGSGRSGVQA